MNPPPLVSQRRFNALNIKRLKEIGSYRGRRHIMGLPVNGQRTKTNARTRKGKEAAAIPICLSMHMPDMHPILSIPVGKRKTVANKKIAKK